MLAYVVLLFAVLSRLLPHALHATAWNFTAVGGGLLFFGSQLGAAKDATPRKTALQVGIAVSVLMAMDFYLTTAVYHFPFHAGGYLVTWVWYAAVCLLGAGILAKPSVLRVAAAVLASSTSFFLASNFIVWLGGSMYAHTLAGLGLCYTMALPFYRNDLVSTAIVAGALFGLPVLAARVVESVHAAQDRNLPAA
jgi:hypothetical protein